MRSDIRPILLCDIQILRRHSPEEHLIQYKGFVIIIEPTRVDSRMPENKEDEAAREQFIGGGVEPLVIIIDFLIVDIFIGHGLFHLSTRISWNCLESQARLLEFFSILYMLFPSTIQLTIRSNQAC